MYISDFAIRRPLVTVVAMLVLVLYGIFALTRLQTDEFPEVNPPVVLVGIPYPGASPGGVEREVVDPVEEAISGLSGVDEITSTAYDGYAQLVVMFVFEKDMQEATQGIRDAISQIRNDLPPEMEEPILQRFDPNDLPIVSLTLASSTRRQGELTRLADPGITRALRALQGVSEVRLQGDVERELTVEVKPDLLTSAGVSVAQIVQAIQAQNLAAPVGRLQTQQSEQTVRLAGRLPGPEALAQVVVATGTGGRPVRLGEVADVKVSTEEARTLALYNEGEAVGIDVVKARGYSTTAVAEDVVAQIETIRKTLPKDVELTVVRNSGVRVESSVENVQSALVEGALLTILVVFLFLNSWRSTVITGIALPVSVLASFIAVWVMGFTLNTMSLLGLTLAIGILIDDAIVVRENIVRHVEMGKDHLRAAHEGTSEIGLAVAATTFSIVAVFVPIAFMSGMAGQWFKPFALTIACAVLVSLFVSFSLDPMLSAYWPDPHRPAHKRGFLTRALDRFNAWFEDLAEWYKGVVAWALDHPKSMIALATVSFVLALALPAIGVVGTSFFPEEDNSEIFIGVDAPPGSSMEYTRGKVLDLLRITRANPEVLYTYTTLGDGLGGVDVASIYVKMSKPAERARSAQDVAAALRTELQQKVQGVTPAVYTSQFQGESKQIQIQLRGDDPEALLRGAEIVLAEVKQVENAVDVGLSTRGQKPELEVSIDRDQAAIRNVSVGEIAQSLRPAFAGLDAGDWVDPEGETRDIMVRLAPEYRRDASDLEWLPLRVRGANGETVTMPIREVARVKEGLGPAIIEHLDRDNVVTVEANTTGRPLSEVIKDIDARLKTVQLPEGVRMTQGGEVEDQQEVFTEMFLALLAGISLMYLILVLQFGSFLDPLAIMLSLPLSLIGVVLALALTNSTINLMSLIGVILLMGIVAKNAILLIDFAKWAREREGLSVRDALIQAGATRLRPILMTTLALIAGMLPVALGTGEGAGFRRPLGHAVIGGTITSTLLTLLVIPVAYEILDGWRTKLFGLFRKKKPAEPPHSSPDGRVHPAPTAEPVQGDGGVLNPQLRA